MDSATTSATFAGLGALAAIVTAGVAVWALWSQRQDSHDRTRPIVTATFRPGPIFSHGFLYLEISNRGRSVARSVRVTFDPAIVASGDVAKDATHIARRYAQAISVVAPEQTFRNLYWNAFDAERGELSTPEEVRVTVAYSDDRGRAYSDTYDLQVENHKHQTAATPSGNSEAELKRRATKAIEAIAFEVWGQA